MFLLLVFAQNSVGVLLTPEQVIHGRSSAYQSPASIGPGKEPITAAVSSLLRDYCGFRCNAGKSRVVALTITQV